MLPPLVRRLQGDDPAGVRATRHDPVPEGQAAEAPPAPRPPRPQPVRGRHGEVHRLRAVRGGLPGRLHLRPRRGQPAGRPGLAGRALRLRLRDQLPALHPLRPVRRGLPDPGHHRVEDVRVLLHEPGGRDLHQGRARRRRRRQAAAAPLGGLAQGRGRAHLGLDAGHVAVGLGRVRGRGAVVRRARLRRAPARGRPERQARRRRHRQHLGPRRWSATRSRAASAEGPAERSCSLSSSRRPRCPTRSPLRRGGHLHRRRARRASCRHTRCTRPSCS